MPGTSYRHHGRRIRTTPARRRPGALLVRPRPDQPHRDQRRRRGHPIHPAPGGELTVAMPLRQSVRLGGYLLKQKLLRREKFALLVELEPLFACNLACAGCGKIQHPASVLKQRMSVDDALAAVKECGAPVVAIAGGE